MNIKSSIKKKCPKCKLVKRKGRLYVVCVNAKCRQRQG
ncbi:MAG: 50S ribosomal protein L36 [Patescibacteria group bacterium]